jgi:hypothetical protein
MSGQSDAYVRVYYSIIDDPKFAEIWGHHARMGAWLHCLLIADALWPASAPLPKLSKDEHAALTTAGLIECDGKGQFRVHGLDAERGRRSDIGRANVESRWYGRSTAVVQPQYSGNTNPILAEPSLDETSQDEPSRALTAPETGPDVWEWVTMRRPSRAAQPDLWAWLTRLCEEYGVVRLWEVMRVCAAQDASRKTLVSRTEAVLSRDADRSERIAETARLAEKRRPVVIQPKPEETPEERERREAAFAKMRESVKQIGIA